MYCVFVWVMSADDAPAERREYSMVHYVPPLFVLHHESISTFHM